MISRHRPARITTTLALLLALATASAWSSASADTGVTLQPPAITILHSSPADAKGDVFVAPKRTSATTGQQGPEIVDEQGRVRASINVLPAGRSPSGDAYRETVLLRLNTERGRPSVKIGSSEQTSGLSFAGPTGTKDTYVVLEAKEQATSLKLRNEDGRELIVKP